MIDDCLSFKKTKLWRANEASEMRNLILATVKHVHNNVLIKLCKIFARP